jgi:toxin ParE1/3/4
VKFQVLILQEAEDDIFDIYKYILEHDSKESAQYVFEQLQIKIESLDELPGRGHYPSELDQIGVKNFLEIHFKPYRIIYEVEGQKVYVHAVLHGRRDIQSLLERRMFR